MREFWNTVTRNWSDSINLLIGAWLFVSVWVLSFASIPAAMWNALILGALVAILAIAALMEWREWEEWTDMLVGAWLVISPWVLGFKSFASASATLEGIEVANMIRKGQLMPGLCPFAQFAALAA